ncbi:MAG: hypothetical protein HFF90_02425 [Oscillibacter sp.]|nr:hypothetical protein [Oscillibacter sp.]
MKGKRQGLHWEQPPLGLLLLALFFLAGVILGQVFAARVPEAAGEELERYLRGFLELGGEASPRAAVSAAVLYVRYPLAAFLLGFSSIGVVLIPCLTGAFGFFLSFSVCCFTAAFGPKGVLLALAVFGLRCAVTLPCYFLLAAPSWRASGALMSLSFGRGRRSAGAVVCDRACWTRLWGAAAVLGAGICAELLLCPYFLQRLLEELVP